MYKVIFTAQSGLRLALRTSPIGDFFIEEDPGHTIEGRKEKRSGCCRFTILWGESRFLSPHELKLVLKTTVCCQASISQCETVLLQYVYNFFFLRCTVQKKVLQSTAQASQDRRLFTANNGVPVRLSI